MQSVLTSPLSPTPPALPNRPPDIHLYPRKGWQKIGVLEVWQFRNLLWLFSKRDITVRYKQTILGGLWALLQPAIQVAVFTIFFGKLMGLEDKTGTFNGQVVPYAVFALTGQVLWNFFSAAVNASSASLMANAAILRKIYVPRLILPLAAIGAPTADTVISLGLLFALMAYYAQTFTWWILLTPLFLLATILAAIGIGILLSALVVTYRDIRFVIPFMIQIWFFITPVIYPSTILPEKYAFILYFNPMTGIIEAFRAALLGGTINTTSMLVSLGVSLVILVISVFYFARVENRFTDIA